MYAAVTPTAGDVLFTGDLKGDSVVLRAGDGKVLYRPNTGGPIGGGVLTNKENGRRYVAVASGNSGGSIPLPGSATVVIFALCAIAAQPQRFLYNVFSVRSLNVWSKSRLQNQVPNYFQHRRRCGNRSAPHPIFLGG